LFQKTFYRVNLVLGKQITLFSLSFIALPKRASAACEDDCQANSRRGQEVETKKR
jgi:hypothetical protein